MNTRQTIQHISNQLDLRKPSHNALLKFSSIIDAHDWVNAPPSVSDKDWLDELQNLHAPFKAFMRTFPSFTFDIATGVGKTRLMAALLLYLHRTQGIKHFFILAPNLTIYKKLQEDFGNPASKKYLFQGVDDFVTKDIRIVTGDNFNEQGQSLFQADVTINIFNIAKFNADEKVNTKTGKTSKPLIKRLGETLGESYWQFLKNCNDLVLMMDEAHRYVADASLNALNELNPRLGIEMTATPLDKKKQEFTNRIFVYNLQQALNDRQYVKRPTIVTRSSFSKGDMTKEQIDHYILNDAIGVHEKIKADLQDYSVQYNQRLVKPLMLVCCISTDHAAEVATFIESVQCQGGIYKDKVLNINVKTYNDEVEAQFVALENVDNRIEIVIHVMKLTEGWDVNNLYTIVPLRAADSVTLVKQTLGRGLRLPFGGERTGVKEIDTLNIVDHEHFNTVVAALKQEGVLDTEGVHDLDKDKGEKRVPREPNRAPFDDSERKVLLDALKTENPETDEPIEPELIDKAYDLLSQSIAQAAAQNAVSDHAALTTEAGKTDVLKYVEKMINEGQLSLDGTQLLNACQKAYTQLTEKYVQHAIEIPRLIKKPTAAKTRFDDFDLDITYMNFKTFKTKFISQEVGGDEERSIFQINTHAAPSEARKNILSRLRKYGDINYSEMGDLLRKLIEQACGAIKNSLAPTDSLDAIVHEYLTTIVQDIYQQLQKHRHTEGGGLEIKGIIPFTRILQDTFSVDEKTKARHCTQSVPDKMKIRQYVFKGFKKTAHVYCRFHSDSERSLSLILSYQSEVVYWLRPMSGQFDITWKTKEASGQYEPDFVVEAKEHIYLVEVKADNQENNPEVQAKKAAAQTYCEQINVYLKAKGKKTWQYVLIPSSKIKDDMDFESLLHYALRASGS